MIFTNILLKPYITWEPTLIPERFFHYLKVVKTRVKWGVKALYLEKNVFKIPVERNKKQVKLWENATMTLKMTLTFTLCLKAQEIITVNKKLIWICSNK